MNRTKGISTATIIGLFIHLLTSCGDNSKTTIKQTEKNIMVKKSNPVVYFEIPVNDMNRAIKFYTTVFSFDLDKEIIDKNEMALFPFVDENSGISGALAKGEIYKPTKDGVVIYFKTENIEQTLQLATSNGGQILYPKTDNGIGLVAEFEDTVEGKDPDLVKAYEFLTKTQLKACVKFCELVLSDCGSYVQIKKVERKPRKVKAVPPEKKAAKFKILADFPELKLKSLPAAQLVDKSEAWLYDSKKRKLIHLVADEYAKVFTVKNNTIIGFSTVETVQKTLRKPAEQLKAITGVGKPAARKFFKDIYSCPIGKLNLIKNNISNRFSI